MNLSDAELRVSPAVRAASGSMLRAPSLVVDLQLGALLGVDLAGGTFLGVSLDAVFTGWEERQWVLGGRAALRAEQFLGRWQLEGGNRQANVALGLEAGARVVGDHCGNACRPFADLVVLDFALVLVLGQTQLSQCEGGCAFGGEPVEVGVRALVFDGDQALLLTVGSGLRVHPSAGAQPD